MVFNMRRGMVGLAIISYACSAYAADDPAGFDHLSDIVGMPPVSWWPLAPGWYLIIGLLLALLVIAGVAAFLRRHQNAYRRSALAKLDQVGTDPGALTEIAVILKRTALAVVPRQSIAAMSGEAWLQWLEQTAPGVTFSEHSRRLLTEQLYRCEAVDDEQLAELLSSVRAWVLKHRLNEAETSTTSRSLPC